MGMDKKDEIRETGMQERRKFARELSKLIRDASAKGIFGLLPSDHFSMSLNTVETVEPETNAVKFLPGKKLSMELGMTFPTSWWDDDPEK
jgi:hypothetical protein